MIIGYTTGVFDMFHVGHLAILKRAKEHCDFLIVGVTSDELVESAKNKKPIIPFEERCQIVDSISFVDKVVEQSDYDKVNAWETHKFNKMFVGDDWKGHPKWVDLENALSPVGVEIVYFPYTNFTSSTILREKLLKY